MFLPTHNNFFNDLIRFIPGLSEGYEMLNIGVLNIDINIYFPFSNQDKYFSRQGKCMCDFMLADFDVLSKNFPFEDFQKMYQPCKDFVYNHRFPNHGWVSLSRKIGRKISRIGYPMILPIDEMNEIKVFILRADKYYFCFPIHINLSQKTPFSSFDVSLYGFDKIDSMGIELTTYEETETGGFKKNIFIVGKPFSDKKNGFYYNRFNVAQSSENHQINVFEPKIKLFAYS